MAETLYAEVGKRLLSMEFEFRDAHLESLYYGGKHDGRYPPDIVDRLLMRIQTIQDADNERVFRDMRSLNFEKLKGQRSHQYSLRINKQWRLILEIEKSDKGNKVIVIGVEDYH